MAHMVLCESLGVLILLHPQVEAKGGDTAILAVIHVSLGSAYVPIAVLVVPGVGRREGRNHSDSDAVLLVHITEPYGALGMEVTGVDLAIDRSTPGGWILCGHNQREIVGLLLIAVCPHHQAVAILMILTWSWSVVYSDILAVPVPSAEHFSKPEHTLHVVVS